MAKVQIMSPIADKFDNKVPPARRLESLQGKRIGLYDNRTGGSDQAVAHVGRRLQERIPGIKLTMYHGPDMGGRTVPTRGVNSDEAVRMAREVDAVVGATAH
jgi:hypothetical protein